LFWSNSKLHELLASELTTETTGMNRALNAVRTGQKEKQLLRKRLFDGKKVKNTAVQKTRFWTAVVLRHSQCVGRVV
jgi:hypothetical protein